MRSFIISSALLIVLAHCGYPVQEAYPTPPPTYPTPPQTYPTTPMTYPTPAPVYPTPSAYPQPKKYPVAPTYPVKPTYAAAAVSEYPQKPTYSAPPPPVPSGYTSSAVESDVETADSEYTTAASLDYRRRAKARTAHNRQFHRRALEPIRRYQKKAKQ